MRGMYRVFYPVSRRLIRVCGTIHVGSLGDGPFAVGFELERGMYDQGTWMPAGALLMIDPRCAVWDEDEDLVYNPRHHVGAMDKRLVPWMIGHPRWPPRRIPADVVAP